MKAPALAWTTLSVNIIVILQGAVVRATGSGAGCGRDWPRCQGELVPLDHGLATWLEFSHRALSGLALLMGIWLLVKARSACAASCPASSSSPSSPPSSS